jgi:glyoxylate/hydroxypyruvate reductase A
MNIVFHSTHFLIEDWQKAFTQVNPSIKLYKIGDIPMEEIDILLIWKPKITDWRAASRLKLVIRLGAGIDVMAKDLQLPANTKTERLRDGGMKTAMCDYAAYAVLHYQRRFDIFQQAQQQSEWLQQRDYKTRAEVKIGVLGLGHLGNAVATFLAESGYQVSGWSRNIKNIDNIKSYHSLDQLTDFLTHCNILINMLPHTEETHHLMNSERLAQLPSNAAIVSLSRGGIIDTEAMVSLIDKGHLRGAFMDVFEQEPLEKNSPLWQHPKITITPHQSAPTQAVESAKEILTLIEEFKKAET